MALSTARTVYLPVPLPTNTDVPGVLSSEPELAWPSKDPGDTTDYTLDCTAWLNDCSDTINTATVSVSISPNDMTASSPAFTSTALTWYFVAGSGGVSTTLYSVTVNFQTTGGRTVNRKIYLPVLDLSPLQGAGGAVAVTMNAALYAQFLAGLPTQPPGVWNNAGVATSS